MNDTDTSPEKIFVVIDPTSEQQSALDRAVALARHYGARIHSYLCIYSNLETDNPEMLKKVEMDRYKLWLDTFIEPIRAKGIDIDVQIDWSPSWREAMRDAVLHADCDLIIKQTTRTRGRSIMMTSSDTLLFEATKVRIHLTTPREEPPSNKILAAVDVARDNAKYRKLFESVLRIGKVPFAPSIAVVNLNIGLLFFLGMTALGVYSVVLGGWSSGSKYSLLGGLRATAQMLSYEVFMGLSLMGVVLLAGSFNLHDIVEAQRKMWFCIPQFLGLVIFIIAGFAETHRLPFDLPEAESELVAGYHTEYSGMKFGMFFVGEYLGITLISAMIVTLFFGGWLGPVLPPLVWFLLKTLVFIVGFILARASLPRPRYDQLMSYAWKVLLPLSLLNLVVTGGILLAVN